MLEGCAPILLKTAISRGDTMAIVTLSKRTFSGAGELAECLSRVLDYTLVSREDIIEKAARYGMSKDRVDRVRSRRLGFLHRMDLEWLHYLVYARAALTKEIRQGNLVYVGDNGRALLHDFPNVLSVNIAADMEYRIDNLVRRTDYIINRKKARRLIEKIDEKEARWQRTICVEGWSDDSEFDLVVQPELVSISDGCDLIRSTLEQPRFQTNAKSLETMDLLTVASELRARIAIRGGVVDSDIEVEERDGVIFVTGYVQNAEDVEEITTLLNRLPETQRVESS